MDRSEAAAAFSTASRPGEPPGRIDGAAVLALADKAQAAWPQLVVERSAYVERLAAGAGGSLEVAATLHVEDLYLALAAQAREPDALRAIEAVLGRVATTLERRGIAMDEIEDVIADVRSDQLVAPAGQTPGIARYAGRASLQRWFIVIAARLLQRVRRRSARVDHRDAEQLAATIVMPTDLERLAVRDEAKQALARALQRAVAELDGTQRTLLRLHVTDGGSIDDVARIFGIHRATAARRLERARRELATSTRRALGRDLALSPWEVDSLIREVRSSFRSLVGIYLAADS